MASLSAPAPTLTADLDALSASVKSYFLHRGLLGNPDDYANYVATEVFPWMFNLMNNRLTFNNAVHQFNAKMRTVKLDETLPVTLSGEATPDGTATASAGAGAGEADENFNPTHTKLLAEMDARIAALKTTIAKEETHEHNILVVAKHSIELMNLCRQRHKLIYHTGGHPLELYKDVVALCSEINQFRPYASIMGVCALMHDSIFTHVRIGNERDSGKKVLELIDPILKEMDEEEASIIKDFCQLIVAGTVPCLLNKPEEVMTGLGEFIDDFLKGKHFDETKDSETDQSEKEKHLAYLAENGLDIRGNKEYQLIFHLMLIEPHLKLLWIVHQTFNHLKAKIKR